MSRRCLMSIGSRRSARATKRLGSNLEKDLALESPGMMNMSDASGDLKLTLLDTLLWLLRDALLTMDTLSPTAGEPPLSLSSSSSSEEEKPRLTGHTFGELRRAGVPPPAASISQLGGGYRISSRVSCLASPPAAASCSCLCTQLGTILSQTSLRWQQ
ncbi:hypothetical protein ACP4OV_018020 [Aristida adscensionis]